MSDTSMVKAACSDLLARSNNTMCSTFSSSYRSRPLFLPTDGCVPLFLKFPLVVLSNDDGDVKRILCPFVNLASDKMAHPGKFFTVNFFPTQNLTECPKEFGCLNFLIDRKLPLMHVMKHCGVVCDLVYRE